MTMDVVYENDENVKLYISDLASVTLSSLSLHDIGLVVSVGCTIDSIINSTDISNSNTSNSTDTNDITNTTGSIERVSYPDILDQPEQVILHILNDTNTAITKTINIDKKNVLVHCIYGQSRSVTITISYLMSIGIDLQSSIDIIKRARPCICINPGFLCQLLVLSVLGFNSPVTNTIINTTTNSNIKRTTTSTTTTNILCKYCNSIIDSTDMILHPKLCTCLSNCQCTNHYNDFLDINIDPFWRNYKSINTTSKKGSRDTNIYLNDNNSIIVPAFDDNNANATSVINDNKKRKLESQQSPFYCSNRKCCKEIGVIKAGSVCHGFIAVDRLLYFDRSKVLVSE